MPSPASKFVLLTWDKMRPKLPDMPAEPYPEYPQSESGDSRLTMADEQTAPAITPEVLLFYAECIPYSDDYWVSGVLEDAAYEIDRLSSELEDAKDDIAMLIAKESSTNPATGR